MASLGELLVSIGADISGFSTAMEQVSVKAGKAVDEVSTKWSGLDKLGGSLTSLGTGLTVGVTAPLAAIAGLSVSSAASLESLRLGLTAVTGSTTETNAQLARLLELAKLPGLGFEEAVRGSIALQSVGLSAGEAERYIAAFGNALATVGRGRAELDAVIVQLQQMSGSSKVLAEDLKPIIRAVPQVAQIMRQQWGTVSSEEIQKLGISSKEFINIIITELEKLPPVTGGIANTFENLKDKAQQSFAKIGDILAPVVRNVVDNVLTPMLDKLTSLAEWFGSLPVPVQTFIGVLAGIAAVAGPVLLAVGGIATGISTFATALAPLATVLGTSVLALGGWAVAIVGAVAALAALGAWVYSNWEPIKAVVFQAWDGLSEAWNWAWSGITGWLTGIWQGIYDVIGPAWDPIVSFVSTIWDGIVDNFTFAWNAIKTALTTVWDAIWGGAKFVFGGIVTVFQTFLDWAGKIPGVNKLFNLDDAWNAANKLKEETEKSNEAMKGSEDAAKKTGNAHKIAAPKVALMKTAHEDIKKAVKALTPEMEIQIAMMEKDKQERSKLISEIATHRLEMEKQGGASVDLTADLIKLNDELYDSVDANKQLIAVVPGLTTALGNMKLPVDDYYDALDKAGIKSHETYAQIATDAKTTYETIANDPRATQWEKDNAMLRMLKAQADAAKANTGTIPAELQAQIDKMESVANGTNGVSKIKTPFAQFSDSVRQSITDLSTSMVKSLFEGDFSFADKGLKALKGLGEAVATSFITPATEAIAGFISGTITDLLGGKGFGAIKQNLADIGSAISGIFGGGANAAAGAAGAAGNAAGAAGSAGSTAAGAAGAATSGIMGVVGAIGSIGTMISSIIGNFQQAKMETTLNAIEESTRYTKIAFMEGADCLLSHVRFMRMRLEEFTGGGVGFRGLYDLMIGISDAVVWGATQGTAPVFERIDAGVQAISAGVQRMVEGLAVPSGMTPAAVPAGGGGIVVTVTGNTIYGMNADDVANAILRKIQESGGTL